MTTPQKLLRVGTPIDVLHLNEFWNRLYLQIRELATENEPALDYAVGRMYHLNATILNGDPIGLVITASHWPYDRYMNQNNAALNNEFENSCFIPPGTYELRVVGREVSSAAIIEWFLNDVSIGMQDWYVAGAPTTPVLKTMSGIVWRGGWVTLRGKAVSKNPSSSSYIMALSKYALVRTGP